MVCCMFFISLLLSSYCHSGDMGWLAPRHKQWLCVMRKWLRVLSMDNSFLTKKIFLHSMNQSNSSCRTWFYRVKQFLISIDQEHIEGLELKRTISTFFKKWAKCTFLVLSNQTLRVRSHCILYLVKDA